MRAALFASLLLCIIQVHAQETISTQPTVSSVLQEMKSPKWTERQQAFGEAYNQLSSADTPPKDADRLRLGVIQLLVTENGDKAPVADEGEGEKRGDFYSVLIDFVGHMGDERAIPALLGACGTGGIATRAVARFGKKALDPTLEQVQGKDPNRAADALFVIRDMLEFGLVTDPDSRQRIRNAVRNALDAEDSNLRDSAVYLVEYLDNREEFVPKLKDIAEHDPARLPNQPKEDGSVGDFYFVRANAAKVLKQIANRQRPPVDRGLPASEYEPVK